MGGNTNFRDVLMVQALNYKIEKKEKHDVALDKSFSKKVLNLDRTFRWATGLNPLFYARHNFNKILTK